MRFVNESFNPNEVIKELGQDTTTKLSFNYTIHSEDADGYKFLDTAGKFYFGTDLNMHVVGGVLGYREYFGDDNGKYVVWKSESDGNFFGSGKVKLSNPTYFNGDEYDKAHEYMVGLAK